MYVDSLLGFKIDYCHTNYFACWVKSNDKSDLKNSTFVLQPLWKMVWCFLTKLNIILTVKGNSQCCLVFTQRSWNLSPHKNLDLDVYGRFIHNCQSLKTTKMSFSRWMAKVWLYPDNGLNKKKRKELSGCTFVEAGYTGKSQCLPLNFVVSIKLILKNSLWNKSVCGDSKRWVISLHTCVWVLSPGRFISFPDTLGTGLHPG